FQKAEADLDYIQHKLELEIMRSLPHDAPAEENPIALLKEIPVLKSRYKSLCVQMDEISMEQKKSMENIQATLDKTMKTVQTIQQRIGLE
ncbi:SKA2 protein, partial [Vireo altiloquus]|nr:SKA2 protein [Vireo altiloquus]